MRVGLFIPCYIDAFFPAVGIATLELLERLGVDVIYPPIRNSWRGCAKSSASRTRPAITWRRSWDGSTPLEIFRRLIVGSEGTLAFIAEAVFDTVPDDQAVSPRS